MPIYDIFHATRTVAFLLDSSSQWLIPFFPPLASLPPELHFGIDSVIGIPSRTFLPSLQDLKWGILQVRFSLPQGDVIGLLLGLYQVILSLFFGISFQTFIIMCGYLVIDALIGVIPIVGDFMDVAFKANIYNLHLLEKELKKGRYAPMIVFASPNDWIPRPKQRTGWRQRLA
ncbi:hypothetical protein DL96DRAFT_1702258 [Flagelloscypha sp. PMI_526]|nr:hypothetical protein DL96DRAFT_1702258 [Flagelloscypha sp. PMI_526]